MAAHSTSVTVDSPDPGGRILIESAAYALYAIWALFTRTVLFSLLLLPIAIAPIKIKINDFIFASLTARILT